VCALPFRLNWATSKQPCRRQRSQHANQSAALSNHEIGFIAFTDRVASRIAGPNLAPPSQAWATHMPWAALPYHDNHHSSYVT
jgi:hypothetical protein